MPGASGVDVVHGVQGARRPFLRPEKSSVAHALDRAVPCRESRGRRAMPSVWIWLSHRGGRSVAGTVT